MTGHAAPETILSELERNSLTHAIVAVMQHEPVVLYPVLEQLLGSLQIIHEQTQITKKKKQLQYALI